MTRGCDSNHAYVALDQPDETHTTPVEGDDANARTVLCGVLQRSRVELSAHQAITAEDEIWTSIAQLAAEYDTIAAAAQRPRWKQLLLRSGLTETQTMSVISGDSYGPLGAALRRAEAFGHDVDRLLPRVVARRDLSDADDIGAVLQHRLRLSTTQPAKHAPGAMGEALIAGLIPEAHGPMATEMRAALDQRKKLIENRATELAEAAMTAEPTWLRRLGRPPTSPEPRRTWLNSVATVAAYRDRYQITSDLPLGPGARTEAERADRRQALAAQRSTTVIAGLPHVSPQSTSEAPRPLLR